jgi:hypothetical protein
VDPKIIELIDQINSPLRSAQAVADLLTCSDGHSLLDDTLADIGTVLVQYTQQALSSSAELHSLLSEPGEDSSR